MGSCLSAARTAASVVRRCRRFVFHVALLPASCAIGCSSNTALELGDSEGAEPKPVRVHSRLSGTTDERTWGQEAKLEHPEPATRDYFGLSVVLNGDTALVSAAQREVLRGAAYVFVRSGVRWTLQQKLTPPDQAEWDQFGLGVALSGDTALVSAPGKDMQQGAAYAFVRNGSTWSEQQKLTASDGDRISAFGYCVALSGDTAFVGAPNANNALGAVYVFVRNGTTWSERQKLTASDGVAGDYFGQSVSLSSDTVLIGAPGDDLSAGAVYEFGRNATQWSEVQRIVPSTRTENDLFGISLSFRADTAVVGQRQSTAASIFTRVGSLWGRALVGSSFGGEYGFAVAAGEDVAFVGGPTNDGARGFVDPYRLVDPDWTFVPPSLLASDMSQNARFGEALSYDAGSLVVGASGVDSYTGAAYVFRYALATGLACTVGADCLSGECSEGVCCEEACAGVCMSCLASRKTNGPDGECGPVLVRTDPRDACDVEDESTCGRTGLCDGTGACALHPFGTECVATTCASAMSEDPRDTCDGNGTCEASPERDCSVGYACLSDACRPTCGSDVDCDVAGGYACRAGECKRSDDGEPCSSATECESGYCVDGVCCNRACQGQCEACGEADDPGNCIPVTGEPRGEREQCAEGPADEPCLATTCDGETRGACEGFAGSSVVCAPAACANGEATAAVRCDGEGTCPTVEPIACGAYQCGATACKSSCDSDSDCAPGSGCDANGRCVSGSTCSDDATEAIDSLGNRKACAPYRCSLGQCGDGCESSSACVAGFACNPASSKCERVSAPAAEEDGGCGCRFAPKPATSWSFAWLFGLGLVVYRRLTSSKRSSVGVGDTHDDARLLEAVMTE